MNINRIGCAGELQTWDEIPEDPRHSIVGVYLIVSPIRETPLDVPSVIPILSRAMLARVMGVIVSMLRSVNLAGHNKLKMDALRAFYESLGFSDVQSYIQSGNVVFKTKSQDPARLSKKIEDEIERRFGFRTDVILRTPAELKGVLARNPFAKRPGLEPGKLLIDFLVREPSAEAIDKVRKLKTDPEELRIIGRELYMYFPNGMGRPKISWGAVEKVLNTPGTGRNLNTVRNLLEIALELESQ